MAAKRKRLTKDHSHYVNNRDFSNAVMEYVLECNDAEEAGTEIPVPSEYIGDCILRICVRLGHRPNFSGYTFREEMVSDAVENCIAKVRNYNIEAQTRTGAPNAFSYFTRIAWNAFIRRIQREERQRDIKSMLLEASAVDTATSDGDFDLASINERQKSRSETLRRRKEDKEDYSRVTIRKSSRKSSTTASLASYL